MLTFLSVGRILLPIERGKRAVIPLKMRQCEIQVASCLRSPLCIDSKIPGLQCGDVEMADKLVYKTTKYVESSTLRIRGKKVIDRALAKRVDELQRTYDRQFTIVFRALRQLMAPPIPKRNPIGFLARIPRKHDRK